MKITCMGGGPAGLYFAISMKLRNPDHQIEVYERNQPDDTFGWGVVFSDQTMGNLAENDPKSAEEMLSSFAHWDDIDIHIRDQVITSSGHGFCGIGRMRLLNILQDRASELGVKLIFGDETEVEDIDGRFADSDLVIVSDGINSKVRNAYPDEFQVDIDPRRNKFVWLGTSKVFDAFTFIFKETEQGWIWAHAYKFDETTSTFIIECSPETFDNFGFADMTQDETCRFGEEMFAEHLDGNELISNARHLRSHAWLSFQRVMCSKWHHKNVVLLGDAAHTAHFSIGSGTKLAFEDAIKLAQVLNDTGLQIEEALEQYQEERHLEVIKIQSAARNSTEWFENVERYLHFEPQQFAYSLLTRSQRVSHENLRLRDKDWLEGIETWFAARAAAEAGTAPSPALANQPIPPMFTPLRLRGMELMNRVVVSPMCMYSADDGTVGDLHMVHYGARAMGGPGLLYTEMTNVSRDARITPGCAGMYKDEHVTAWKRIVDFVHANSQAKMAIQLGHAGRKGSTKLIWEAMDEPLDDGNWEIIGPSPIPWAEGNQVPREMNRDDMDQVIADHVRATEMADQCGFDMLEMHSAHGYLLSTFVTPVSNQRRDEYGGSLENRLRFPLQVFGAMRAAWPDNKPMSVRISATDWVGDLGVTPEEAVEIARAFHEAGADIIDVSAGQTTPDAAPIYGRMFQTPLSDRIRNDGGFATMAVGNIFETDHVNSIIAAGRADLCCLARPHLMDPSWTLRAAAAQHYHGVPVPQQYSAGFEQLERLLERQAAELEALGA